MKVKKIFALLLAVCMLAALFAACTNEEPQQGDNATPPAASPTPGSNPSPTPDAGNEDEGDGEDEEQEIVTIEFWWTDYGVTGTGSKIKLVEDAINAYTEEKIGVHINFTWIATADYQTQFTLAVSNNEPIDVSVYTTRLKFLSLTSTGAAMDISGLVDTYAPDLLNLFGEELMASVKIGDGIYGFPNYRILNSNYYFLMRTDVLERAGVLDAYKGMKTWADFEAVMQAVVDVSDGYAIGSSNSNGLYGSQGCLFGGESFADAYAFDYLGDTIHTVVTDQDGNVDNLIAQQGFKDMCKRAAEWFDAGYVYPDTPFLKEGDEMNIQSEVYSGVIVMGEYGADTSWSQKCGVDLTGLEIASGYLSTGTCQKFGTFVPVTSEQPEAALKFLNLLYTDANLMNLFIWGVEGETYVLNADGQADYPAGTDQKTCGYHGLDYSIGNQFLCLPWAGSEPNFRENQMQSFKNAPTSKFLGCTVDTSTLSAVFSALTSVNDEFYKTISSGMYTESQYEEYLQKLDAAGIDEWINLYQTTLDDFNA